MIRKDAYKLIMRLKERGVKNISILTGDDYDKAHSLASKLGIDRVYANCTHKLDKVAKGSEKCPFNSSFISYRKVGDGIFIPDGEDYSPLSRKSLPLSRQ